MSACSELMSQDEIDALTSGASDQIASSSTSEALTQSIQGFEAEVLESLAKILSSMLAIEVEVESVEVAAAEPDEFGVGVSPDDVVYTVEMDMGEKYPMAVVTGKQVAIQIANPMIGHELKDDLDSPLDEMKLSASREVISQGIGGMAVKIGEKAGKDAQSSMAEVFIENQADKLKEVFGEKAIIATATLKVGGEDTWQVRHFFGETLAKVISPVSEPVAQAPAPIPRPKPIAVAAPSPTATEGKVTFSPAQFEDLPDSRVTYDPRNLDVLLDVPLTVTVLLGKSKVPIKQVLEYGQGSLITLDKLAGEPIDLLVNGKYFARGEVVVIDENFGVRISSILTPEERLQQITSMQSR